MDQFAWLMLQFIVCSCFVFWAYRQGVKTGFSNGIAAAKDVIVEEKRRRLALRAAEEAASISREETT